MIHAILGAGGVGGFLGGALARSGVPVTFMVRPETANSYPGTVTISSGVLGDFETRVTISDELSEPVDVIWITVKATQLDTALEQLSPKRIGDSLIVPLLNGVDHVPLLRTRYGPDRVVAGTIRIESERVAPGYIRQLSPFASVQLAAGGDSAERAHQIADDVRRAGLGCDVVEDESSMLWGKLVFLAPLALTTTAKGGTLGEVRDDPYWRDKLLGCFIEARNVAAAEGAHIDRDSGIQLLENAPAGMRSSMQKDVGAGRPPEIDAIGGPIVRLGHTHHLDVSTTEGLIAKIRSTS